MDLYKYLSNGVTLKNMNIDNVYNGLVEEFKKGNITYPRSDGFNHDEISIIDFKKINSEIKELLLMENRFPVVEEDGIVGDFFTLAKHFYLATPGSIYNDYKKIEREHIVPKPEYIDLSVGLKKQKEYEDFDFHIKSKNFNMEDFLVSINPKEIKKVEIQGIEL